MNRSDGKPPAKTLKPQPQRGSFDQVSYIAARPVDAADGPFAGGLLVHGGFGLARYNVARRSFNYRMLAAPWNDSAEQGVLSSCHAPVMPVFGDLLIYFDDGDSVVAVRRADLRPLTTRKDRDSLVPWRQQSLPCGEPQWLALAAGVRANPKPALLVGGTTGVTALDGTTGQPLWTAKLNTATAEPAVARGRVFLTSPNGTVRCLAAQ